MAGQVQLSKYNQESLYNYHSELLLKQADCYFLKEKFAIESGFNDIKAIYSNLLKEVLCTDECEIINFLNKKLTDVKDCNNLENRCSKYKRINNYY